MSMIASTIALLGLALTPLIAPLLGYGWIRRNFGAGHGYVFAGIMATIVVLLVTDGFQTMTELTDDGAWTAATLAPVHVIVLAFSIMLVVTVVWTAALWLFRRRHLA